MAWTPPPQPSPFNVKPEDVLFLDIETVPKVNLFKDLDQFGQDLFSKKMEPGINNHDEVVYMQDYWKQKAALYAEFNKIACVSLGVLTFNDEGERVLRVKSFFGYNEMIILDELLPRISKAKYLCAHNGKKFDFPLLARKYMQYGKQIPSILNVTGVKPWDVNHFDTMEVWQFNDSRAFISLDTLAYVFGLPSPKQELDGSRVAEVYYGGEPPKEGLPWEDERLCKVATYCEGDVKTLANIYLMMIRQAIIKPENIIVV